MYHTSYTELI